MDKGRGSIGDELKKAIRGSKIALILLSKNYASSKWCLEELVEIMKCRKSSFGQIVLPIFYEVNPSDIKNRCGYFGEVFMETCKGEGTDNIARWERALADVATIPGYHLIKRDNEADMIDKIANEISYMLNNSSPSSDFNDLIGMRSHMEMLEPSLHIPTFEVRMIGIWGPAGSGKTTIARALLHKFSNSFQKSVFVEITKLKYNATSARSDHHSVKLQLQQQLISQITQQKDIEISHLGAVQDRCKFMKLLIVLDDVDDLVQLDAMVKEPEWFGPGSRIIITTRNLRLLKAHKIKQKDIHRVKIPTTEQAVGIFCKHAFNQEIPKDGFEDLVQEITQLAGKLPLGLRVMGLKLREMSKEEWTRALPRLKTLVDDKIESVLKSSYDALNDKDKDLFLYIACFFNGERIVKLEEHLVANKLSNVRHGVQILAEKSLISINRRTRSVEMHTLLVQMGREIVRKQFIHDPEKRIFLVDAREICDLLCDDTIGSERVKFIDFDLSKIEDELKISERDFKRMPSNLHFLRIYGDFVHWDKLYFLGDLKYQFQKLRLLDWMHFPLKCLPLIFNPDSLVELNLRHSKLEKLWEGIKPLRNLKWMDLSCSKNLKEIPDLSTAKNLKELDLSGCSSLETLSSSISKAINLQKLYLNRCTSLVEIPSCIGNLQKLSKLSLQGCIKLQILPVNINLESLSELDLTDCKLLKTFPEISTKVKYLKLRGTGIEKVPSSVYNWSHRCRLHMSYSENLEKSWVTLENITVLHLSDVGIQEISPWIESVSCLRGLLLTGCRKLRSLPDLPYSLTYLDAENCESLETLDCSFPNPKIYLNFGNCFNLNEKARDLIIQTRTRRVVLPGKEMSTYFTYRASGDSLTVKLLKEKVFPVSLRFKVCVLLVKNGEDKACDEDMMQIYNRIMDKMRGVIVQYSPISHPLFQSLTNHLYTYEVEAEVTSSELVFNFYIESDKWKIGECGVCQILEAIKRRDQGSEALYSNIETEPSGETAWNLSYMEERIRNRRISVGAWSLS